MVAMTKGTTGPSKIRVVFFGATFFDVAAGRHGVTNRFDVPRYFYSWNPFCKTNGVAPKSIRRRPPSCSLAPKLRSAAIAGALGPHVDRRGADHSYVRAHASFWIGDQNWSLTSLKEKLIKIGPKVVSYGRYVATWEPA